MMIVIVGNGVVGNATGRHLKEIEGQDVRFYDVIKEKRDIEFKDIFKADFLFICLPTPTIKGKQVLTILNDFMRSIKEYKGIIVIKSTVIPGTCERYMWEYNLRVNHFPEFLTEANAYKDACNPDRFIIAGEDRFEILQLYKKTEPHIFLFEDTKTSEMIKYANNYFLALKVAYANEMYDMCEKAGIKYFDVQMAISADSRIGSSHLNISKERGFGGMCFPKDTVALLNKFPNSKILKAMIEYNTSIRKDNHMTKVI